MPKPFPLPFQVGIDVCNITRIARLLRTVPLSEPPQCSDKIKDTNPTATATPQQEDMLSEPEQIIGKSKIDFGIFSGRQQFLARLFNYHEWRIKDTNPTATATPQREDMLSKPEQIIGKSKIDFGIFSGRQRFLARLFNYHERRYYLMLEKNEGFWFRDIELDKRNFSFVAGRYAAKEAIIKAIRHRKVNFHDIIILPSCVQFPSLRMNGSKLKQLIPGTEAPRAVVLAKRRDLTSSDGVVQSNILKNRSPEQMQYMLKCATKAKVDVNDFEEDVRRWEEGEEVQLNISHDGDYAVAVCLASTPSKSLMDKTSKKDVDERFRLWKGKVNPSSPTAPSKKKSTFYPDLDLDDSGDSTKEHDLKLKAELNLRQLLPGYFTNSRNKEARKEEAHKIFI